MSSELPPALAERAAAVMRDHDEGERRIPWAVLDRMTGPDLALFQSALIHAMAADPYLDIRAYVHRTPAGDELVIRWRRTAYRRRDLYPTLIVEEVAP